MQPSLRSSFSGLLAEEHDSSGACLGQDRPGLVVLTIELENVLHTMTNHHQPTKLWSPYREPLALFLNKYTAEVCASIICASSAPCLFTQCSVMASLLVSYPMYACTWGIGVMATLLCVLL